MRRHGHAKGSDNEDTRAYENAHFYVGINSPSARLQGDYIFNPNYRGSYRRLSTHIERFEILAEKYMLVLD